MQFDELKTSSSEHMQRLLSDLTEWRAKAMDSNRNNNNSTDFDITDTQAFE